VVVVAAAVGVFLGVRLSSNSTSGVVLPAPPPDTALVVVTTDLQTGTSMVLPVDMATGTTGRSIPVPVGADAIAAKGNTAYILSTGSNTNPHGLLTPLDVATQRTGAPIAIPDVPESIVLSPNGIVAWVVSVATTGTFLVRVNLATRSVGPPITLASGRPSGPPSIALATGGRTAYVATYAPGTLRSVNLVTGALGPPQAVGTSAGPFAITPNGDAYVTNPGTANVGHTVTPLDLATGRARPPITVGPGPQGIVTTPDGKWAFVTNGGTTTLYTNTVTPIDLATDTAQAPITVGVGPDPIALNPSGTWAVVGNTGLQAQPGTTITFLDVEKMAAGRTVSVHGLPGSIAVVSSSTTT